MKQILRPIKELLVALCILCSGICCVAQDPDGAKLIAIEPQAGVTTPGSTVKIYGTGFSPDAVAYFGGLEARETKFISSSTLEVITPYVRPGSYQLQLRSGGIAVRSEVTFAAGASQVDHEIDRSLALARQGNAPAAIAILTSITKTHPDHQVRSFGHYQIGQIYFAQGDWWRWAGETSGVFDSESGAAVQTSWEYRLSYARSVYLLPVESDPDTPLRLADWAVKYDITQNPEPRFFRGLANARYGNLQEAKIDSDFINKAQPENASYRALASYVGVLTGGKIDLESSHLGTTHDPRALSLLGEAAYLAGNGAEAHRLWTEAGREYPLGASLALWAGKKHLARGQHRIADSLLTECVFMAPDSNEAREAKDLLAKPQQPSP